MKPQRSRTRSKNNRNRPNNNSGGGTNVVNRVFDSSGPEGKVRGTPQQIIDKYNQLARDAQLSNDRVATETFQQHAEHYMRMLSEATREMEVKREEQERQNRERQIDQDRQNRERQAERDREREERIERQEQHAASQPDEQPAPAPQPDVSSDPSQAPQPDVVEAVSDNGLVERSEETQPKPKPRQRRKPRPKPFSLAGEQTDTPVEAKPAVEAPQKPDAPEAAE